MSLLHEQKEFVKITDVNYLLSKLASTSRPDSVRLHIISISICVASIEFTCYCGICAGRTYFIHSKVIIMLLSRSIYNRREGCLSPFQQNEIAEVTLSVKRLTFCFLERHFMFTSATSLRLYDYTTEHLVPS